MRYRDSDNFKRNKRQYGIFWSVCVFCFLLAAFSALSGCSKKSPPSAGSALPKFTLSDLKGAKITVPDDYNGKVLVVRFWVDWCKSCEIEMPIMDEAYKKYKDRGFVIIAVNVGQTKETAGAFATKLKLSYPVVLDTDSSVTKRFGVKAVPFTFIVDRKGVIRKRIFGETGSETLEKIIQDLL